MAVPVRRKLISNRTLGAFMLGLRRLEDAGRVPIMHLAVLEETLEHYYSSWMQLDEKCRSQLAVIGDCTYIIKGPNHFVGNPRFMSATGAENTTRYLLEIERYSEVEVKKHSGVVFPRVRLVRFEVGFFGVDEYLVYPPVSDVIWGEDLIQQKVFMVVNLCGDELTITQVDETLTKNRSYARKTIINYFGEKPAAWRPYVAVHVVGPHINVGVRIAALE